MTDVTVPSATSRRLVGAEPVPRLLSGASQAREGRELARRILAVRDQAEGLQQPLTLRQTIELATLAIDLADLVMRP